MLRTLLSFSGPEPSYWDEAGPRPIQARTEHAACTRGAEGASCVLCLSAPAAVTPKERGVECPLDKMSSWHPQPFGVASFCPQRRQLGLQGLVVCLNGYQVCRHNRLENYVMIQNEQKCVDEGSVISKHAKRAE